MRRQRMRQPDGQGCAAKANQSMMRVLAIDRPLFRHRVVAARHERVASKEPFETQPRTTQGAMSLDRGMRVAGTARIETATRSEQRTQGPLIEADDAHQDEAHVSNIVA